jgi:acetoin utilization protein AcuB
MDLRDFKQMPPIKAAMTPFPFSVDIQETAAAARAMMEEHGIRHLPVKDGDLLVGVISDRDLRLALDPALGLPPADRLEIGAVCVRDVYLVEMNEPLDRVLDTMARRHLGSALVVKDGRLAGVFTTTDACRQFGQALEVIYPPGGGDRAA